MANNDRQTEAFGHCYGDVFHCDLNLSGTPFGLTNTLSCYSSFERRI